MNERHLGGDFDDFLREEGLLEEVEAVADKRVLAYAVAEATNGSEVLEGGDATLPGHQPSSLERS